MKYFESPMFSATIPHYVSEKLVKSILDKRSGVKLLGPGTTTYMFSRLELQRVSVISPDKELSFKYLDVQFQESNNEISIDPREWSLRGEVENFCSNSIPKIGLSHKNQRTRSKALIS